MRRVLAACIGVTLLSATAVVFVSDSRTPGTVVNSNRAAAPPATMQEAVGGVGAKSARLGALEHDSLASVVPSRAALPGLARSEERPRETVYWAELIPAGDLDGDGNRDLFTFSGLDGFCGCDSIDITVHSGISGSPIWSRSTPARCGEALPGMFGAPPRPGILVLAYTFGCSSWSNDLLLTLVAFDGEGETIWTREFRGSGEMWSNADAQPAGEGLLEDRRSGGTNLLVTQVNYGTGAAERGGERLFVVDGRDGTLRVDEPAVLSDATTLAEPVGDVNGDGVDEFVLADAGDSGDVDLRDGVTGDSLWISPLPARPDVTVTNVGDVTGDGTRDIAVGGRTQSPVRVLDGATGRVHAELPHSVVRGTADADKDGRLDLASAQSFFEDGKAGVVATHYSSDGRAVWSKRNEFVTDRTWDSPIPSSPGDVNGDGFDDWLATIEAPWVDQVPEASLTMMISGRDGNALWRGSRDVAIPGTFDGRGPDMMRIEAAPRFPVAARDGATGRQLWSTRTGFEGWPARTTTVDVNADGIADVIAGGSTGSEYFVHAYDGRDGSHLWGLRA